MIIDHRTHKFDNCPECLGLCLVVRVPELMADPVEANRIQTVMAVAWCEEHSIPVTEKEYAACQKKEAA